MPPVLPPGFSETRLRSVLRELAGALGDAWVDAPEVPPAEHIADWADVKLDPIDVAEAGALLPDAVQLMQDVGWK